MKLIALAKSLKPFLQKEITLEGIYKEIFTNKSIPFTSMLTPVEVVKLVFITKKVLNNEDPKEIMSKLDNGLFLFSTVEFGDSNQEEECSECYGDGRIDCSNCDGEGEENCPECDGEGSFEVGDNEWEDCGECHGGGKVTCNQCDGEGRYDCDYCDSNGYISIDDYIPYDLGGYISYDENLKNDIQARLLRNDIEDPKFSSKMTFLLSVDQVGIKEGETENIKLEFENREFYLELITDDVYGSLIYGNNRVISSQFDTEPLEKFT